MIAFLIVDNNQEDRIKIKESLSEYQFYFLESEDIKDSMERILTTGKNLDLISIDINTKKDSIITYKKFISELKEHFPIKPLIIIISKEMDYDMLMYCMEKSVAEVIIKPIEDDFKTKMIQILEDNGIKVLKKF